MKVQGVWALVRQRWRRAHGSGQNEQRVHICALRWAVAVRIDVRVVVVGGTLTLRMGMPLRRVENV